MTGRRTLAQLLALRSTLEPGEVVTLLVPLAGELAQMHRSGRVCAAVGTETVVVADDGRPMFVSVAVESTDVAPADDVRALAALGWLALTGRSAERPGAAPVAAPPLLIDALLSVLFAGAGRGPDAATLADAVLRACPAQPIRLDAAAVPPVPVHRPRNGPRNGPRTRPRLGASHRRRATATAVAVVAVVVAVVAAATWPRHRGGASVAESPRPAATMVFADPATSTPAAAPSPARAVDWTSVVTQIEQARANAFVSGDARALRSLYAWHSAVGARDVATMHALVAGGLRVRRLHALVFAVDAVQSSMRSARCRVVDAMSSYVVVDRRGVVVRRASATPEAVEVMQLARVGGRWRVAGLKRGR